MSYAHTACWCEPPSFPRLSALILEHRTREREVLFIRISLVYRELHSTVQPAGDPTFYSFQRPSNHSSERRGMVHHQTAQKKTAGFDENGMRKSYPNVGSHQVVLRKSRRAPDPIVPELTEGRGGRDNKVWNSGMLRRL